MLLRSIACAVLFGLMSPAYAEDAVKPNAVTHKTVALTYIVEHPAIDAARKGIIEALADAGYVDGKTLTLMTASAQGNMTTQMQIAKDFAGHAPDLIIAISTPSAQACQTAAGTIPIIFAAVTDPVGAKLVASLDRPGGTVTGTSDQQPFGPTLDLIRKLTPAAKTIGVIYNPGEANSVSQVEKLKIAAAAQNYTIVEGPASQSAMVGDAAASLVGRADVILIPTDSTVTSAVESVVNVGKKAKIPVYASDTGSVERGAMAALGFNYHALGLLAGKMAVKVLGGASPANIPVGVLATQDLYINPTSAEAMGVSLAGPVVAEAAHVVR
jgi:putative tryptophan/tyrosine transport system substrate-binding protein